MSDAQTKVSSKVKEKRKFEALLVKQTSRADNGDCQVVNLFSKQLEAPHLAAQLPHQSNPSLRGCLPRFAQFKEFFHCNPGKKREIFLNLQRDDVSMQLTHGT